MHSFDKYTPDSQGEEEEYYKVEACTEQASMQKRKFIIPMYWFGKTNVLNGISLEKIKNEEHRRHIKRVNKKGDLKPKKEIQSETNFFKEMIEGEDIGKEWRKKYAKDVSVILFYTLFNGIEVLTNLKTVKRSMKLSYNLNTYISNYYNILRPFLEALRVVKIDDVDNSNSTMSIDEAFAKANLIPDDASKELIEETCKELAASIKDYKVIRVLFTRSEAKTPIFIPLTGRCDKKSDIVFDKTIAGREHERTKQILLLQPINPPKTVENEDILIENADDDTDYFENF